MEFSESQDCIRIVLVRLNSNRLRRLHALPESLNVHFWLSLNEKTLSHSPGGAARQVKKSAQSHGWTPDSKADINFKRIKIIMCAEL